MKRERLIDRACRVMKPICNCISVAAQRAKEAEVEVASKRRFRQMLASGEASLALPQGSDTGLHEVMAHTGVTLKAFLDCLTTASRQAEQSEIDVITRRSFGKKNGSAPFGNDSDDPVADVEPGREGVEREQHGKGHGEIIHSTC